MFLSPMDIFIVFIFLCLVAAEAKQGSVFDVTTFGAVGDGQTDSSQAFSRAWEALVHAGKPTSILRIPPNQVFLLQPLTFRGPTKSKTVHILVLGTIIAPEKLSWEGKKSRWIKFVSISGLIFNGQGLIDGRGESWWDCPRCSRPASMHFHECNGLRIKGLNSVNSPMNHISISGITRAEISNLHLTAPATSPNTDGVNIADSTQIHIRDSFIGTGDDCVAINKGSSYINITNVACGPGHGISVGSLGADESEEMVEHVYVQFCNFTRSKYGIRIKTWSGGSGYARKIMFQHIRFEAVHKPIVINQNYCPDGRCKIKHGNVKVSDVSYIGVHGTSEMAQAITLNCSGSVPCTNIFMNDVQIESVDPEKRTIAYCENAHGTSSSTSPVVPCLT